MSRLFAPPRPFLLRLSLPIPLRHLSTRAYLYTLDHLGQLFLASTKLRNFTSCYKEKTFLDLYYRRLRPNAGEPPGSVAAALREQGYTWISPCGNETNYLKPDETPLVFQRLEDGYLTYAGTGKLRFRPEALRFNPSNGYLYHPSPPRPARSSRTRSASAMGAEEPPSPYGPYSLLRSSLVLEQFASTLEWTEGGEGSYEWEGRRWGIASGLEIL